MPRGWWLKGHPSLLLAGAFLCIGNDIPAQPLEDARPLETPTLNDKTIENDGLNNLVIQRTVTALGNRFFDAFASYWRAQSVEAQGVITIEEQPWMTEGTEVIIRFQRETIYRTRVWPRNPSPEETAERAVPAVAEIIQRYQSQWRD